MKIHKLIGPGLALLLALAGCGDSSSRTAPPADDQGGAMELNVEYEVAPGDVIRPTDAQTRVAVRHLFAENRKYLTLLAGAADLLHGEAERN